MLNYKLIINRIQKQYLFIYFAVVILGAIVLHHEFSTLSVGVHASTHASARDWCLWLQ